MNKQILKIENLSHRYSTKWAIKDINLEIEKQGVYGLLGANGAGKSTLMNIVCGVIKQTSGNVAICELDISKEAIASKKKIGFLPQKPPLQTELTIIEYLDYCAGLKNIAPQDTAKAIEYVMEICSLTHMKDRLISNLSGGYQQRVGIAQAIIHKPEVVVFDEPTNGLDPNQILDIRKLIRSIAEDRTVFVSTHILSEVKAICDKIIMMDEGSIVFNGTINDFDNYITPNSIFVSFLEIPSVDVVKNVEGVIEVEYLGETNYRIRSNNTKEAIQNIVKESVANNWKLNEIALEKSSMDNVFAALSNNNKN